MTASIFLMAAAVIAAPLDNSIADWNNCVNFQADFLLDQYAYKITERQAKKTVKDIYKICSTRLTAANALARKQDLQRKKFGQLYNRIFTDMNINAQFRRTDGDAPNP